MRYELSAMGKMLRDISGDAFSQEKKLLVGSGLFLLLLTCLRYVVAYQMPLSPDEAYYRLWALSPAGSYFDHPPAVAFLIRGGLLIGGDTPFGVRFFAPLCIALTTLILVQSVYLYQLFCGLEKTCALRRSLLAGGLLNATIAVNIFGIVMTPDVPLMLFSALLLLGSVQLAVKDDGRFWVVIGMAMGMGLLSKFVMFLTALGMVGWLVLSRSGRKWLLCPWLWVGGLVALLILSPCLWWNYHHDWISFSKQGSRVGVWHPLSFFRFFPEWVFGQFLFAFPPIFIGFILGLWRLFQRNDMLSQMLKWSCCVPLGVFAFQCFSSRVQANWIVYLYPSFAFLAVFSSWHYWRSIIIGGVTLSTLIDIQAVKSILPLSPHWDVALRQTGGWENMFIGLERALPKDAIVGADEYGLASELAFYMPNDEVVGLGKRWAYFERPRLACSGDIYLLRSHRRKEGIPRREGEVIVPVMELSRKNKGKVADNYTLFKVRNWCQRGARSDVYSAIISRHRSTVEERR